MSVWSDQSDAVHPEVPHAGSDEAEEGGVDLRRDVAVVPRVLPAGSLTHDVPHEAEPALSQKSVLPNRATVGVLFGSPVTMCSSFISTGSAR